MNRIELLNQLLQYTIWLPIEGYDNYEVSICGQVRNVKTKRILRPYIVGNGYYCVKFYCDNMCKNIKVHHLVANAFIPKLDITKKYVDHIDNNKLNNTISNLRWCDLSENQYNRQLGSNNKSGIKGVYY